MTSKSLSIVKRDAAAAKAAHLPRKSWWIQPDFYQSAHDEQERMRLSPEGQGAQNFQAGRPQVLKAGV